MAFLERQQPASVADDMRVGRALAVDAEDGRVAGARVAGGEERSPRRPLQRPAPRADPAVAVARAPAADDERVDHAFALQRIVRRDGRELRVWADAVEDPGQPGRQGAFDPEIRAVGLRAQRREGSLEQGIVGREGLGHRALRSESPAS